LSKNGQEGLEKLDQDPQIDLVLMDIMMPEMDGYEATRRIRKQKRFAKLPIIAVTAKAMKDDLEKCLDAGTNDYISKPVDLEKLLSLIRVWMPQSHLEKH
jgi:CheY-like chemotaxis protein